MRWEAGVARGSLRIVDTLQALPGRPVRGKEQLHAIRIHIKENTLLTIAWSLTLDIHREVVKHVEIFQEECPGKMESKSVLRHFGF